MVHQIGLPNHIDNDLGLCSMPRRMSQTMEACRCLHCGPGGHPADKSQSVRNLKSGVPQQSRNCSRIWAAAKHCQTSFRQVLELLLHSVALHSVRGRVCPCVRWGHRYQFVHIDCMTHDLPSNSVFIPAWLALRRYRQSAASSN